MYDLEKLENLENIDDIDVNDVNSIIELAKATSNTLEETNTKLKDANNQIAELKAKNAVLIKQVDTGEKPKPPSSTPEEIISEMFGIGGKK